MLSNVKGFCKRNIKPVIISMMVSMMAVFSAIGASAVDETATTTFDFDLTSVVETSLNDLSAQLGDLLGVIIPIAFAVMIGFVGAKKAMSWIKGMVGKI